MDADIGPIARWLRTTRERQAMPDGRPWTQDYFLDRLAEAEGWTLARSNYSKYETGAQTPKPETLAKFVRFWADRGEAGPDFTPIVAVDPMMTVLERIAVALETIAGISPDDSRLSPGDSSVLREIAARVGRAPSRPRERRPEAVTG